MAAAESNLSHLDQRFDSDELITEETTGETSRQVEIPHKYKARDYQRSIWDAFFPRDPVAEAVKRAGLIWHRRAGKDKTAINITIVKAQQRVGHYLYLLPEATQAKKVIWHGRGKDGVSFRDHFPSELVRRTNSSELLVEFNNGSIFQLGGADKYDAWMGTNPLGIVFSEYSIMDPMPWNYFRPILAENDGWALFIYTPRGKNHGYFMRKLAEKEAKRNPKRWFFELLKNSQTKVVSKEAIEAEKAEGMSDQMAEQEFECSFEAFSAGAYYGKQMQRAWKEKRVGFVPVEEILEVHTFWDLGIGDAMAIWLLQATGKEIRAVGYYENQGEGMAHYINWLKKWAEEKGVRFGEHWAPHDIEVRELMTGKKRKDTARKMGIKFRVMPSIPLEDGIEAVRNILSRCWFDETACEQGINCLTEYAKAYDEKNKVYMDHPKHDWASHGADAFRTFAVSWKDRKFKELPTVIRPGPSTWSPHDPI